jgi:hypothetical protein
MVLLACGQAKVLLLASSPIAEPASLLRRTARVYRSASDSDSQPKVAINWCGVAPLSATHTAAALRIPCTEHCGRPAWSHQSRNFVGEAVGGTSPFLSPHAAGRSQSRDEALRADVRNLNLTFA